MSRTALLQTRWLIACSAAAAGCGGGDGGPQERFQEVQLADTEQAYADFIESYPESPLVAEALARLEQLAYQEAEQLGTTEAFESFQQRFAGSSMADEAVEAIEALEFQAAARTGTVESWEAYLDEYPQSALALSARDSLARLEYEIVVAAAEVSTYERFLSRHPSSDLAADVQRRLDMSMDQQDWDRAVAEGTPAAYLQYFRAHSNTARLTAQRGVTQIRVTPPTTRRGGTIRYGGEGEPQIEIETEGWVFRRSLAAAGELGIISDDFVMQAAATFADSDAVGGLDERGRFRLSYARRSIENSIALLLEGSNAEGQATANLIAVLNEDMSLLELSLDDVR